MKQEDLLLSAYQKLYAALQSLERFSKGQDLFENISCIDSFLSEFRNVTFVLQKSLAHTDYMAKYDTLIDKYLKNDDCKWLKNKRNEVLKEKPFSLEKQLKLTLYLPNGAGVFPGETYTIDDEEDYSSLIEMAKRVIEKIPAIEVFFSVEFIYREVGSERNLFGTIDNGIDSLLALLEDLDKMIAGEMSKARELVLEKIKHLHFHSAPKDFWFIDDYVFYRKDHVFEKGERFEVIMPKVSGQYTVLCEMAGVKNNGRFIEETFDAFVRIHIGTFSAQKKIAPTLLVLHEEGELSMVMYDASLKTTTYRKIHEIYAKGRIRYDNKIPPGYRDDTKDKKEMGVRHVYGDLIAWMQIMDYAKINKKNIIFVGEDLKDDRLEYDGRKEEKEQWLVGIVVKEESLL